MEEANKCRIVSVIFLTRLCTICVRLAATRVDGMVETFVATMWRLSELWKVWKIEPLPSHRLSTTCAHVMPRYRLYIEFIPNLGYLLTDDVVEFDGFFDLFD